jgi:diaminohydroxyphosphoribosylaminopyrimidine deaminase/5-amino-6-(5-phosphoribosylamino)uracil reductase
MPAPAETAAMRRAIALAAAGLGTTSPNPPVGCVILADGVIAGEGYHQRKGEAHAEVQALTAAGPLAAGATAVVTLEPCNHHGRTPPCRQALIDAGITRVVVALADPTSRGDGGNAMLRAAGVDVETGVLADEAGIVMTAWLAALRTRRPFITWPYQLADQGIAPLPDGTAEGRRLRLNADAVLTHDGSVSEAVPGTHGAGILSLKDAVPGEDPHAVAAALYDGGVRRLLLHGGIETAVPFLGADLVDSVVAYMPDGSGSRRPRQNLPWPLLPPGFTLTDVDRIDGYVRAAARRPGLR